MSEIPTPVASPTGGGGVRPVTPTLVVSEVFGPTVQGEGPSLGRRCSFVRLMGCDLHCTWCDTPFTWNAARFDLRAEGARRTVDDITEQALTGGPDLVVVSGGEPLLHQDQPGWLALLDRFAAAGVEVEVETNGTRAPRLATVAGVARFNVSPKLAHAGDPESVRVVPEALAAFAGLAASGRASFKFVAAFPDDVEEITTLVQAHDLPRRHVWVMPLGTSPAEVLAAQAAITDPAIAAGFNVTTRLHTLVWGDERGR